MDDTQNHYPVGITADSLTRKDHEFRATISPARSWRRYSKDAERAYAAREAELEVAGGAMRQLERNVLLSVIGHSGVTSTRWTTSKGGIGLRAMAQRDPLVSTSVRATCSWPYSTA